MDPITSTLTPCGPLPSCSFFDRPMSPSRPRPPASFPPRRATLSLPTHQPTPQSPSKSLPTPPSISDSLSSFLLSLSTSVTVTLSSISFPRKSFLFFRKTLTSQYHRLRNLSISSISSYGSLSFPSINLRSLRQLQTQIPAKLRSLPPLRPTYLLLLIPLFLIFRFFHSSPPLSPAAVHAVSNKLRNQPGNFRAIRLSASFKSSSSLLVAASACTFRDAIDGLLLHLAPTPSRARSIGVVDVGAAGGIPVSKRALRASVAWVVAIEPANDLFWKVKTLHGAAGRLHAVRGIAGKRGGVAKVDGEEVSVFAVDELLQGGVEGLKEVPNVVLSIRNRGKEAQALEGARKVMGEKVKGAVIRVEMRHEWRRVVGAALEGGLRCWSLWSGTGHDVFANEVGWRTADLWAGFVNATSTGGVGELLCVRM